MSEGKKDKVVEEKNKDNKVTPITVTRLEIDGEDILNKDDRLTKKHGVVVMLDALGVRDYNKKEAEIYMKHKDEVVRLIDKKSTELHEALKDDVMKVLGLVILLAKGLVGKFDFKLDDVKIERPGVIAFGDTLIIYWHVLESYLPVALWLLPHIIEDIIPYGINNGILWRGSIGAGEYYIDSENSNIILGPAVKDAISWYEIANWIGIIASPRCGYVYEALVSAPDQKMPLPIVKYNVPLKDGIKRDLYALNWVKRYCEMNKTVELTKDKTNEIFKKWLNKTMFTLKLGDYVITRSVSEKYENTYTFFEWCMKYNYQFKTD